MKKLIALSLGAIFLTTSIIHADDTVVYKEESVYGLMAYDGSLDTLRVVNGLSGLEADYGDYQEVENLTDQSDLASVDGKVSLPSSQDRFYYEGLMTGDQSPWLIDIKYYLNDQQVPASDLVGATGSLRIDIEVGEGHESQAYFYDHYALQVGLTLSSDLCKNVVAEGATLVDAAGNRQVAFNLLPGKGGSVTIQADVRDFEMDPITFTGVRMAFDMEVDTTSFEDQIEELIEAVAQLDDGALELKDGISQFYEGMVTYNQGLNAYKKGLYTYAEGGKELALGLAQISGGLNQLSQEGAALEMGLSAFEAGSFAKVNGELLAQGLTLPELTKDNYEAILSMDPALMPVLEQLKQTFALTEGMKAYIGGVSQLAPGLDEVSVGVTTYVDNAKKLADSCAQLVAGSKELETGLLALKEGLVTYQMGTAEFREGTATMDDEMASKIDEMIKEFMGDDSPLISFTSSKNDHIDTVQFFYKTAPIEKEEPIKEVIVEEEEESFFTRLLDLFGL